MIVMNRLAQTRKYPLVLRVTFFTFNKAGSLNSPPDGASFAAHSGM